MNNVCELCDRPLIGGEDRYCSGCLHRCGVCHQGRQPCAEEDTGEDESGNTIWVCLECAGVNTWYERVFGRAA